MHIGISRSTGGSKAFTGAVLGLALAMGLAGCEGGREGATDRSLGEAPEAALTAGCRDQRPGYKNLYFGDLHTHTSYSLDAYFFNALTDPRMAHRFAKAEAPLPVPAKGSQDVFTAGDEVWLDRPLDFNAVTDHAEFLGGFVGLCDQSPASQALCDSLIGQGIRDDIRAIAAGDTPFQTQVLQSLVADMPTSLLPWLETKEINDAEYAPCRYTTLHGYEFTSGVLSQMFHRNVIFRGDAQSVPIDVFPAVNLTTALLPQNANDDWALFDHLQRACVDQPDCDVLTIVHNSNRSDGRMFLAAGEAAGASVMGDLTGVPLGRKLFATDVFLPMTADDAALRRRIDKSFEMTQHKGQSECAAGLSGAYLANDESFDPGCTFEMDASICQGLPEDPPACAALCTGDAWQDPPFCGWRDRGQNVVPVCAVTGPDGRSRPANGGDTTGNCRSPLDYYRYAMVEGQKIRQTLGINPYKLNISASLDTHAADSGKAAEANFRGHGGVLDDEPAEQLGFWACADPSQDPRDLEQCEQRSFVDFSRPLNPGGLTGVWAPANTREHIFDAIAAGESFGTSGPRLRIRSAASWQRPPADICDRLGRGEDLSLSGMTPMGGNLPPPPTSNAAPWLAIWAEQDPEGVPLQQIDLIEGYLDADNQPKVRFHDGLKRTVAPVQRPDPSSCAVAVDNHPESLCLIWQDPNFDSRRDAYWYARVRELPSCRWTAYACHVEAQVDCGALEPATGQFPVDHPHAGYEGCCAITQTDSGFSGQPRFDTIEERAWASPIWYEPQ